MSDASPRQPLQVRWLGRIGYAEALSEQERLVVARRAGEVPDTLLLLEHPPVVTMGRGGHESNLLLTADELSRRGVELHDVGRGGDVTYHGPGQLVGYPVVRLPKQRRDAHRYLRDLEEAHATTWPQAAIPSAVAKCVFPVRAFASNAPSPCRVTMSFPR